MSQQNVDVVRASWEAWNRRDLDAVFSFWSSQCEFDVTRYPGWPDIEGKLSGKEAVRHFFSEFLETWETHEGVVDTLVDAGDDRVFAVVRQSLRGRSSGAEVAMHWAQIYTVSNGRIERVDNYSDRSEAREAAGLPEAGEQVAFEEFVERLRMGYQAFNAGDLDTVMRHLDPGISWQRRAAHPLAGRYEGHRDVLRDVLMAVQEQFEEFELEPLAFRAHGEHIIVTLRQRGRGRIGGVPIEAELVHVWRAVGGRGKDLRSFSTLEEALAALGDG
jgi:ketosteroid isomerase-like protein